MRVWAPLRTASSTFSGGVVSSRAAILSRGTMQSRDLLVRQAEHVLHELGLVRVEDAGLLRVLDQQRQFLDRVDQAPRRRRAGSRAAGRISVAGAVHDAG